MATPSEGFPPNTNEIRGFFHCRKCDSGPQDIEVGRTPQGVQVWCRRHNCNIIHIGIDPGSDGSVKITTSTVED